MESRQYATWLIFMTLTSKLEIGQYTFSTLTMCFVTQHMVPVLHKGPELKLSNCLCLNVTKGVFILRLERFWCRRTQNEDHIIISSCTYDILMD